MRRKKGFPFSPLFRFPKSRLVFFPFQVSQPLVLQKLSSGLVATSSIRETSRPLVAIPEPLVLTPAAALFSLERSGVLSEAGADSLASYAAASGDLAAPISLVLAADALRLASRLKKGSGETPDFEGGRGWQMSPWGAYTASLSPPPSLFDDDSSGGGCAGWFLAPEAREAALARSFPSSSSRRRQISKTLDEALRVEKEAAEATAAAALLGSKGRNKITPQLLTWARSQICSRAFAAPSSSSENGIVPALLPVIDLCNHSPRGGFPAWGVVSSSSAGSESNSNSSSRLCWLRNAAPLAAGEELTTDYSRLCGGDAGAWMANYGFVPAEVKT